MIHLRKFIDSHILIAYLFNTCGRHTRFALIVHYNSACLGGVMAVLDPLGSYVSHRRLALVAGEIITNLDNHVIVTSLYKGRNVWCAHFWFGR
jgi:hypothetical protein